MSKKYAKKYLTPSDWSFENNPHVGTEWTVAGSKKDSYYTVAMTSKGFTCDCYGFQFHSKCKHSSEVIERFDCDL